MFTKAARSFYIVLLPAMLLSAGCASQPADTMDTSPPESVADTDEEIEWGREIGLDEMIEMARGGRIVEIQWHVIPNILRARASDGLIYHLRNEDKGVDLRNTLMEAGVKIGKDGVLFRHVF
jgi:hypothetical protein